MNPSVDVLRPAAPKASRLSRPMRRRTPRVSLRDRAWMPFHTVRAVGPIRTPSAARVRELLIKLSAIDPAHPLLCRIDESTGRQSPVGGADLDHYLSSVVIEVPAGLDAVEITRLMQERALDGLPFMIAISDRAAGMRSAHAIGDTSTANPWFFGLLRADDPDRALDAIIAGSSSRFPLAAALINHFGRDPRRAVRAVRRALPLGPAQTDGAGQARPVRVGVPELVAATAPGAVEERLRQWRRQHAPTASMAAVWMAASVRALQGNGIETGDGVFTMMNCRRYLPDGAAAGGNFAVGPYLLPDDLGDPNSLGSELAGAAADGVPLILLSAIAARSLLRRGRPAVMGDLARPGARPKINLSYFGGISQDDLDWAVTDGPDAAAPSRDDHGAQYVVGAEPAGPQAITYVFARSPYGMHLSATAHPEFVDVPALRTAISDVARDPVALLER